MNKINGKNKGFLKKYMKIYKSYKFGLNFFSKNKLNITCISSKDKLYLGRIKKNEKSPMLAI